MIDFSSENLIPMSTAAKDPVLGKPVHVSTLHRWQLRGVRGIRLETWMVGGRRMTSREALVRFLERINKSQAASPLPKTKTRSTPGSSEAEDQMLDGLGL